MKTANGGRTGEGSIMRAHRSRKKGRKVMGGRKVKTARGAKRERTDW
jgi:hypothetical protein